MAGAGAHVDNIDPILLSAGLVEGYILGGDETVESSKGVLSIIVASGVANAITRLRQLRQTL